jgi:hypothetical protein
VRNYSKNGATKKMLGHYTDHKKRKRKKKETYKTYAVLTAYLNNTQNDNKLKKCPIHVPGKGGEQRVKEMKRK